MQSDDELRVVLASVPDRERLVAEVWLGDFQVCEISSRNGRNVLEVSGPQDGQTLAFGFEAFLAALEEAAKRTGISIDK